MSPIEYHVTDGVAVISLNRPDKHNAQNEPLLDALDAAWRAAATDEAVKVIVVRANGDNFSSGHDLRSTTSGYEPSDTKSPLEKAYGWETEVYLGYSRRWRDVPKPSIASVKGACVAGALNVIWPCDLIIAADNTHFSDPVVKFGIGGVEYHAHTWELGPRRAKEMLFTARSFSADEAFATGMVNRVVPLDELDDQTMELAREIAQMDAWALLQAKRAVNQTLDIQGQQAALQSAFDMHWLGHANSMLTTGYPLLSAAPLPADSPKTNAPKTNAPKDVP